MSTKTVTLKEGERYTLKLGRWGTFFYDEERLLPLNNEDVLRILNNEEL